MSKPMMTTPVDRLGYHNETQMDENKYRGDETQNDFDEFRRGQHPFYQRRGTRFSAFYITHFTGIRQPSRVDTVLEGMTAPHLSAVSCIHAFVIRPTRRSILVPAG